MEALLALDRALLLEIHQNWRCGVLDAFFVWLTTARHFLIPLALLWAALLIRGGRRVRLLALLLLVLIALTDQLASQWLKPWIGRVRPCFVVEGVAALRPQAHSPAFPSSHAANTFAVAALVTFARGRRWSPLFLLAALVGLSRIYVGVHYPTDVVAGGLLGLLCATVVWFAARAVPWVADGLRAPPRRDS
jgi:undecaprenyl-diphosphatase